MAAEHDKAIALIDELEETIGTMRWEGGPGMPAYTLRDVMLYHTEAFRKVVRLHAVNITPPGESPLTP